MSISIIPTGFPTLDKALGGGLRTCSLTLIAGRPGMGKTSFLAGLSKNGGILLLDDENAAAEELKVLALTRKIPVAVTVCVPRYPCEVREDMRPILSDLSPDLVRAADFVLAIYRD